MWKTLRRIATVLPGFVEHMPQLLQQIDLLFKQLRTVQQSIQDIERELRESRTEKRRLEDRLVEFRAVLDEKMPPPPSQQNARGTGVKPLDSA